MSKNYKNYSNYSKESIEQAKETLEVVKETIEEVEEKPADPLYGIVIAALNFREAPTFDANIIEVLQKGDKLLVSAVNNGWLTVWFNGVKGYVKEEFVKEA